MEPCVPCYRTYIAFQEWAFAANVKLKGECHELEPRARSRLS
ncbi:hypothetical protein SCH4B_0036 [Ruegeria sp. TrichCH4B]|nr:hypothetical protein SCH4B_0036 [Ruegeria sp. TrichCH4B]